MIYYLKISKNYLTTRIDPTTRYFLGYINDYTFGELLIPFTYNGELVEYLECADGDIITLLRLPAAHVAQDENGVYYDRALNKCYNGEIQLGWLMYAYGKFGYEKILTDITNINLK